MIKENADCAITEGNIIKIYNKNNKMKNNKAITLIALIITVVVLLILARSKYSNINW